MELTQSITITKTELAYLLKATSRDGHRLVLTFAWIESINGKIWIATTDTHRLHAISVGRDPGCHIPAGVIDIRRLLHEIRFYRTGHGVTIQLGDISKIDILNANQTVLGSIPVPVWFPVEPDGKCNIYGEKLGYPNWKRIVPEFTQDTPYVDGSFNFRYLLDAASIASLAANRVHVSGTDPFRPYAITQRKGSCWDQDWFAVLMPMATETVAQYREEQEKMKSNKRKAA